MNKTVTCGTASRVVFLDYLRVAACFMVIVVHSVEPFYLAGGGTYIASLSDGLWATFIDSAFRAAVPLFVLASSYLLFPLKTDTPSFFKRRLVRVFVPFAIWSVLYAVIPLPWTAWSGDAHDAIGNLKRLCFNFLPSSGHLWFIYMLIGLYILMPVLSPWVEKLSKKGETIFLCVWALTTTFPFVRKLSVFVTGTPELWGECSWNEFGTFYYVSGFAGYLVLGHYLRTYVGELSWKKTLAAAVPLWLAGYAIVSGWFLYRMPKTFPVSAPIDLAVDMETSWMFCSFGVLLTTVAYFLLIKKCVSTGFFYKYVILPVSKTSYGIYLMHIFVLTFFMGWTGNWGLPTPLVILVSAVLTFCTCAVLARLIALLPGGKYLIG